jgi:phosphate:Na+ symporter
VPTLALDALAREVARAGQVAVRLVQQSMAGADAAALRADFVVLTSLDGAIERFVERLRSAAMSQQASARLAELLRIERYHEAAAELALGAAALPRLVPSDARVAAAASDFRDATDTLLRGCDPAGTPQAAVLDADRARMEARYEDLKVQLLAAGADGGLPLVDMEQALRRCSALRRAAQQLHKARRRHADR